MLLRYGKLGDPVILMVPLVAVLGELLAAYLWLGHHALMGVRVMDRRAEEQEAANEQDHFVFTILVTAVAPSYRK